MQGFTSWMLTMISETKPRRSSWQCTTIQREWQYNTLQYSIISTNLQNTYNILPQTISNEKVAGFGLGFLPF